MHAGGLHDADPRVRPAAQLRPQDGHDERQRRAGHARRDGRARGPRRRRRLAGATSASRCASRPLTYVSDADAERRARARWRSASTACAGTRRPCSTASARATGATSCARSDDGIPTVIFGDGEQGARPPTGHRERRRHLPHRASARRACVGADRLTLLRERPLGIASVTNPLPTTGAADPETARRGARERAADGADDGADRLAAATSRTSRARSPASARRRRSRSGAATGTSCT